MRQLTYEEAVYIFDSGLWKELTVEERGRFQLYQERVCMPFSKFHEGVESILGRPVWTHEFARSDLLKAEIEGRIEKPDMAQIFQRLVDLVPNDKEIFVVSIGDTDE